MTELSLLPDELLIHLFTFVQPESLLLCERVSRRFHRLISMNLERMRKFDDYEFELCFFEPRSCHSSKILFENYRPLKFSSHTFLEGQEAQGGGWIDSTSIVWRECRKNYRSCSAPMNEVHCRRTVVEDGRMFEAAEKEIIKITNRLSFEDVDLIAVDLDEILPLLRHLRKIDSIRLNFSCRFTEDSLLQLIQLMAGVRVHVDMNQQHDAPLLSSDFFRKPELRKLAGFKIAGKEMRTCKRFTDKILLEFLNWPKEFHLENTAVTVDGLGTFIKQWKRGEREVQNVVFDLPPNLFFTEEEIFRRLHSCEICTIQDGHRVLNLKKDKMLALGVDNFEQSWFVEIDNRTRAPKQSQIKDLSDRCEDMLLHETLVNPFEALLEEGDFDIHALFNA